MTARRYSQQQLFDWLWLAAWGVAASLYCVLAARQLGATFDEPFYVSAGLDRWRVGSDRALVRGGTMPLPAELQTLPVYLYEYSTGITFDTLADLDRILPYARLGNLLFFWVTLIYGRSIGRALAGPWGGRLAVAFLAVEPNVLGHAGLATTDIAITGSLLALAYHYAANRDAGRWIRRVGLPGFWFGVALLSKASALVFGPVALLAIESRILHQQGVLQAGGGLWSRVRGWAFAFAPSSRRMAGIVLLGLAVALVYCGTDWRINHPFLAWARRLPDGWFREAAVAMAVNLRISPNAGDALFFQIRHNVEQHAAYVAGFQGPSLWFYFPLLLTIKMTLPFLLLTALLLVIRPRALGNWAFVTFVMLIALSPTFRVQIGLRMVLPAIALGVVGLAVALVNAYTNTASRLRRAGLAAAIVAGTTWSAMTLVAEHPHALCYTNELWGSTDDGYVFVSDANYDWGQGLPELKRWRDRHGIDNLDVWYFGSDPLRYELPMRFVELRRLHWTPAEFLEVMRGRRLAVSTTYLYGAYSAGAETALAVLRSRPAMARTRTFIIYDFTK